MGISVVSFGERGRAYIQIIIFVFRIIQINEYDFAQKLLMIIGLSR